ncbi:MAG: acyl-CoA dehydratase activase [Candidatus Hodarchaeales archaeon]|jgi:predicted CoA-substrate-specific enzyme activase
MITYGLDLGAGSIKGLLLEDGSKILAYNLKKSSGNPLQAAEVITENLLQEQGLDQSNIEYTTTTGFSRYLYPQRDLQLSDITANARGTVFLYPKTATILDIGTQSTRAINISDGGKVKKFKFTEKCAAGAGRFVERCSKYLQVPMEDLGKIAMESKDPQLISSVCAVLAETEIINLVATEKEISDIIMGVFLSIADRATTLLKRVGLKPELTLVGGLVHNKGITEALNQKTGLTINFSPMGHYSGALGAAVLGFRRAQQLKASS